MKLISITLSISVIALYAYINRSYKYASVEDQVDASNSMRGLKQGDVYEDKNGNQVMLTSQAPLDYESDQYKENEAWFSGMGRCWMKTYTQEQVDKIIENMHERDMKILDDYSKEMNEIITKLIAKAVYKSITFGMITGVIIGVIIGNSLWHSD